MQTKMLFCFILKRKHSIGREFQSLAVQGKKTSDIDILATSRNSHRKITESIRITSRPPLRIKSGTTSGSTDEHLPK